jgi:CRP-like cAMP-binding protein
MRAKRDAYLDHLSRVPMFRACSRKEIVAIGRHAEDVFYNAGDDIVREGTLGSEFFVITDGRAKVTRKGRKVAELGAGGCFGELALLAKLPRDATVTAVTPMEVLSISGRDFAVVLTDVPTVTIKLLKHMAQRLHELDRKG